MEQNQNKVNDREEKTRRRLVLLIQILVLSLFWNFIITIAFNYDKAKSSYNYTQCLSNLKRIDAALELYKSDNEGLYPPKLAMLTPGYMKNIPRCRGLDRLDKWDFLKKMQGKGSYEDGYQVGGNFDRYTIYCRGEKHGDVGVGENYPRFNSIDGLTGK